MSTEYKHKYAFLIQDMITVYSTWNFKDKIMLKLRN
jgi:hypothetical protein